MHDEPRRTDQKRHDPEGSDAADRARQAATQSATVIIQSIPSPISHQTGLSSPNGIAIRPSRPAGITQTDTTGIASRLAITP